MSGYFEVSCDACMSYTVHISHHYSAMCVAKATYVRAFIPSN